METAPVTVTIQDIWTRSRDESLTEFERQSHTALGHFLRRYTTARREVAELADFLSERMKEMSQRIANHRDPSGSGEVQSLGSTIDVHCASLHALRQSIETMCYCLGYDREALIKEAQR